MLPNANILICRCETYNSLIRSQNVYGNKNKMAPSKYMFLSVECSKLDRNYASVMHVL